MNRAPTVLARTPGIFPWLRIEQESVRTAPWIPACPFLRITVTLWLPDCLMKSVRAWMVLAALEPLGTVLVAQPNEEALEAEAFDRDIYAAICPPKGSVRPKLKTALRAISELEAVTVQAWASPIAADAPPAATEDVRCHRTARGCRSSCRCLWKPPLSKRPLSR